MQDGTALSWAWRPAAQPAAPQAAVAWGAAAKRLHARLRAHLGDIEAESSGLQVTASRDVLVVMGAASALPWVEGIEYAAPHPEAPQLWLPTLQQPDVPFDLLAQALIRRYVRQPLLVWPSPAYVLPLDRALPLSAALLAQIDAHWHTRADWLPADT
ncbi:hypothetical protein K6V18_21535 [Ralstonia insidiosa]|uniref:bpX5 domain-containing protein n=1 Tax=Ralstonia TaxID=48736 RepID=UPI000385CDE9|nr:MULTISPECIES: hypothetical protein [Ralstonia]EPX96353.1 hypothetical protein C404_19245 [Ralstonia sp. AU12-08]MBY4707617.1 hypothetical protein [Ralstonia insidiosa]GAQ28147.1 putative uncharacterized protein [Ralstonia sp. NT80]